MEKEVTMTSELVTEEDQETDKEFLPMLAYEKMKDLHLKALKTSNLRFIETQVQLDIGFTKRKNTSRF